MPMTEERMILQMVQSGRVTAEEAVRLLAAIEAAPRAAPAAQAAEGWRLPREEHHAARAAAREERRTVREAAKEERRRARAAERRQRHGASAEFDLTGANLYGAKLEGSDLTNCRLADAN